MAILRFVAFFGALAAAVYLGSEVKWESIGALAAAVVTVLGLEIVETRKIAGLERKLSSRRLPSGDRELLKKYVGLFNESLCRFLREQDMGAPFLAEIVDPLFQYGDSWKGVLFEFHDMELEAARQKLHGAVMAFFRAMVIDTYGEGRIVTMGLRDNETRPEMFEKRDRLNDLSSAAADGIEEFQRVGRRRLAESEAAE